MLTRGASSRKSSLLFTCILLTNSQHYGWQQKGHQVANKVKNGLLPMVIVVMLRNPSFNKLRSLETLRPLVVPSLHSLRPLDF